MAEVTELAASAVTDRASWPTRLDELHRREVAHTHEGDAIAGRSDALG